MASIKFGNHDPANLLYALSPAHWREYFIHLPDESSQFIVIYSFI